MPSSSASSSGQWTEEEQRLLEDGLLQCAAICDPKEKWKAIAAMVETRDARACAERFKACRRQALEDTQQQKSPTNQGTAEDDTPGEASGEGKWHNRDSSSWNYQASHSSDGWKWDRGWWWQDGKHDDGWQQESWKESSEDVPPTDEAERRRWESQREIEANRKRAQQREEQKQRENQAKEAKLKAERDQKEKERMDKIQERQDKIREMQESEEKQRKDAEHRQRELQRQRDMEDASAGFYGHKHLGAKASGKAVGIGGKGPVGWAGKAATSKGQLQKQRKQEEMERQAAEVLANIGSSKVKQSKEQDEEKEEDDEEEDDEAWEESQSDHLKAGEQLGADNTAFNAVTTGKGSESNKGAGKKGTKKGKGKRSSWWHKIDGDCPISLVPINELLKAPFALNAEGSSVPHYFDARFLANFLLSSCDFINPVNRCPLSREDCVALDKHLQNNHRETRQTSVTDAFDLFELHGRSGSDSVRREATAVLQHLFSFRSARDLDRSGRAINYNDDGLMVIDDDDIQVSAAQHVVTSNAAELGMTMGASGTDTTFPSLGGAGGTASQVRSCWTGKGAKTGSSNQAEAYPSLPSSSGSRGRGNDAGKGGTGKSTPKPKGRGGGGPPKQASLHSKPKGWGSQT